MSANPHHMVNLREGGTCERCHRLGKECTPSTSTRKRGPSSAPTSKRAKLEEKLDEVVSLLKSQRAPTSAGPSSDAFGLTPESSIVTSRAEADSPALPFDDPLTDAHLVEFRNNYLGYIPFMHLPERTTPGDLQADKPLLCLAIRTACTKAITPQMRMSSHLREVLASKILAHGERNMDLLFSLIMCIGWSKFFAHRKQFLGQTCGLARAVISDLRLDKPKEPAGCPSLGPYDKATEEVRTSEGYRALLAVFILCTSVSKTFGYDSMLWSPQCEEACEYLAKNNECEGDVVLVSLARLAKVAIYAMEVSRRASEDASFAQHVTMAIEPLKLALHNLQVSFSPGTLQHRTVIASTFTAEVAIYELALLESPASNKPSLSSKHPLFVTRRVEYLLACLEACRSCCDYTLAGDIRDISVTSMLIFPYCLKVVYKLAVLKDVPGWDPAIATARVDILHCLEQIAVIAEDANAKYKEETGEDSVFREAAVMLRATAPNWRVPTVEQEQAVGDVSATAWNADISGDFSLADFANDFWLSGPMNF
ncbi:Zn(II)2Cys6 transcription factor [Pyrenophora seminiperda CCB06]|uniref:Zn(II)2Cys6 transcription factor n=1 Tax=Pyrenophora seminiperda CCB06 TaxID=1302712 RepID=A0A3M7MDA2_9PLEO|nr:Zn(II)2Cys6 transcription factor [Pyrenophora seminiperda CCB06]